MSRLPGNAAVPAGTRIPDIYAGGGERSRRGSRLSTLCMPLRPAGSRAPFTAGEAAGLSGNRARVSAAAGLTPGRHTGCTWQTQLSVIL